jgi:RNA chaperone Hfq
VGAPAEGPTAGARLIRFTPLRHDPGAAIAPARPGGTGGSPQEAAPPAGPRRSSVHAVPTVQRPPRAGAAAGSAPAGRPPTETGAGARGPGGPPGGERAPYQEALLNGLRRSARPVEVLCLDGRVLRGTLVNFDTYSLILDTAEGTLLVFKHAVAVVRAAGGSREGPGDGGPP